ncbi:hypothetical protein BVRB_2g030970 [Beta vulgaris subsp. vulgaris]|nr:hypothetical protein BVRB_2g030970 [Beta vulgaris subsp. vulgaris]
MEFEKQQHSSVSLKHKLKLILASCCNFSDSDEDDIKKNLEHSDKSHTLSAWLKSELPSIKVISAKIFAGKLGRNRRANSVEFGYDPLSYSLNFEDDDSHLDEYPLRNFSSRLPPSPVKEKNNVVVSTQIAGWS